MKKFVGLAALGLVALFVASPAPAAPHIGGIGGIGGIGRFGGFGGFGVRGLGFRVGDFGLSSGWGSPRLFSRPWAPGYYRPYAGASYYYPYAAYYPNAGVSYYDSYTAFYPQDQSVDWNVNVVTIRMRVPSDARVWFEGEATSQSGADRTFVSPSLAPGRE